MKSKLTEPQNKLIALMKHGNYVIVRFRGIGTRYPPSTWLEDMQGKQICTVNGNMFIAIRKKGILEEFKRDNTHSMYRVKT